jgi:hypothetical protein
VSIFCRLTLVILSSLLTLGTRTRGAELTAHDLTMSPATIADVVVSGGVTQEETAGVNILLEIIPRAGATGTVRFTSAPPVDIEQLGDPWPGVGTFSPYDTDLTASDSLNGSVDDNGNYVPEMTTFAGNLASYPVQASEDADGEWDVFLSTFIGDSNWEGLPTSLESGTISVTSISDVPALSEWAAVVMALLLSVAGTLALNRQRASTSAG